MSKKIMILDMFYNNHLKQIEIAKELNVSKAYVTKIIKCDSRYTTEKNTRKEDNVFNRRLYLYNYLKDYRAKKKEDKQLDEFVKKQHEQASYELSAKPHISKTSLRKSCGSIYDYNSKTNSFHVKKNICVSFDMPRTINMNKKILIREKG
ncbi:MAG: hypothetical protein PHP54_03670 [Clostridia bacterium]|nr:hypothetical protein [Clostridia bacterium]